MVEDEKVKAESALQNSSREYRKNHRDKEAASNSNREISVSEAKIIQDLAKNYNSSIC